jgi:hypothetical protein
MASTRVDCAAAVAVNIDRVMRKTIEVLRVAI